MIPKLSAPLVKDIRTGEGVLEDVLAVVGIVAAAVGDTSAVKSGIFIGALALSKSVRRGLLKGIALQKSVGIGAPLQPAVTLGGQTPDQVLAEIGELVTPAPVSDSRPQADTAVAKAAAAAEPEPAA